MKTEAKTDTQSAPKPEKKTGADRTQRAVRDEWWSDERVLSFLDLLPGADVDPDYHVLLKAYRGMVPEAFERFLEFFTQAGRNVNAPGPGNITLTRLVATHKKSAAYLELLKQAGGK